MQTKLVKSLIAGTIGAALSAISLYGMNPAGMAAYGAIQGSSLMAVPSIPHLVPQSRVRIRGG